MMLLRRMMIIDSKTAVLERDYAMGSGRAKERAFILFRFTTNSYLGREQGTTTRFIGARLVYF